MALEEPYAVVYSVLSIAIIDRNGTRSITHYQSTFGFLLTYAPSFPVVLLASILVNEQQVPRHSALAEAADFLLRHDRLLAFSFYFGVPLMDRTFTLSGTLRIAPLVKPPPTASQVENFCRRFALNLDPTTSKSKCQETLRTIMLGRARNLWEMTENNTVKNKVGNIYVAWSGGIDSTVGGSGLERMDRTPIGKGAI